MSITRIGGVSSFANIACSSSGDIIYITISNIGIYISEDSERSYTLNTVSNGVSFWQNTICSSTGRNAVTLIQNSSIIKDAKLYFSYNFGHNWSEVSPPNANYRPEGSIAMDETGEIITTMSAYNGNVYYTTNHGISWNTVYTSITNPFYLKYYTNILCDNTGTKLFFTDGSQTYTSSDSGINWYSNTVIGLNNIASDRSLKNIVACKSNGIYNSSNYGSNFTLNNIYDTIHYAAIDPNGQRVVGLGSNSNWVAPIRNLSSWSTFQANYYLISAALDSNCTIYTNYIDSIGSPQFLKNSEFAINYDSIQILVPTFRFQLAGPFGRLEGPKGQNAPLTMPIINGKDKFVSSTNMTIASNLYLQNYTVSANSVSATSAFSLIANLTFFTPGNGQWQMAIGRSLTSNNTYSASITNIVSQRNDIFSLPYSNFNYPYFLCSKYTSNFDGNGNYVSLSGTYIDNPGATGQFYYQMWLGYISDNSSSTTLSNIRGKISILKII